MLEGSERFFATAENYFVLERWNLLTRLLYVQLVPMCNISMMFIWVVCHLCACNPFGLRRGSLKTIFFPTKTGHLFQKAHGSKVSTWAGPQGVLLSIGHRLPIPLNPAQVGETKHWNLVQLWHIWWFHMVSDVASETIRRCTEPEQPKSVVAVTLCFGWYACFFCRNDVVVFGCAFPNKTYALNPRDHMSNLWPLCATTIGTASVVQVLLEISKPLISEFGRHFKSQSRLPVALLDGEGFLFTGGRSLLLWISL